ncbi:MAG: hypothetical protein EHM18_07670 [Acidobacteria bacterium]|nr:MAG: hypothetical protein EHM18_07670 [Acidobacteriota bacterium]
MIRDWFPVNDGLAVAARLSPRALTRRQATALELVLLILCGAAAATATALIRLRLGIPGHAIVLSVIPMVVGLALAPRRLAGFIMGASALATAASLSMSGTARFGSGAITSLCLVGPILDLALARARTGWRLYLGIVSAGIGANLVALGSRAAAKLLGLDLGGNVRPFDSWWAQATITYTLCGAIAGLIAAVCCFRWREQRSKQEAAGQ